MWRWWPVLFILLGNLTLANPALDSDADGYPDATEISSAADRAAFLDWFASIAEAQYTAIADDWDPRYRDCSGLLRYAFVEALKTKDTAWFAKFPFLPKVDIPPLRGLSYPMPEISRSVFRIAPGAFSHNDVELGKMVGLSTATELMNYATVPAGR